jgi:hypothetical protein
MRQECDIDPRDWDRSSDDSLAAIPRAPILASDRVVILLSEIRDGIERLESHWRPVDQQPSKGKQRPRKASQVEVLSFIAGRGPSRARQIAERFGLSYGGARNHLDRLLRAGRVQVIEPGLFGAHADGGGANGASTEGRGA